MRGAWSGVRMVSGGLRATAFGRYMARYFAINHIAVRIEIVLPV